MLAVGTVMQAMLDYDSEAVLLIPTGRRGAMEVQYQSPVLFLRAVNAESAAPGA